jgi:hypothetical protein
MAVEIEPLAEARERIREATGSEVIGVRRLPQLAAAGTLG